MVAHSNLNTYPSHVINNMMHYRVHTLAIALLFFAVPITSGQSMEWSVKGGVGGSYVTERNAGSSNPWFGNPSDERFDPVGAVTMRVPLGQSIFYAGAEPGLTLMGAGKTDDFVFGDNQAPFTSRMLFLTAPLFVGVRAPSGIIKPYFAFGAGPHILLHSKRSSTDDSDLASAFDNYRLFTAAAFIDTGIRIGDKKPMEFGVQWQRTVPHGYKSASGLTLHTVNAQVYFRVVL
jgi:hypothetical protein